MKKSGIVGLIAIIYIVMYGISWIMTCGIIKLITMCFGWDFTWSIATGVWLIICILKSIFSITINNKK